MPNYSCGGCWRFWGLDHSTLKAHIFYTFRRKSFWPVSFERTWKMFSEAHKFCPLFFNNSPTVILLSTVKIVFSDAWPIPLCQAVSVKQIDIDKRDWSYLGKHSKTIKKSMSLVQFHSKRALQWHLKVQWKWYFPLFDLFNFEGAYLLHCWEKMFLAASTQKSIKKAFRSSWILLSFFQKWPYSNLTKYSKHRFFLCLTNPTLSSCFCLADRYR